MVGTILPVVYGERSANLTRAAHMSHLAGLVVGGLLTATALGRRDPGQPPSAGGSSVCANIGHMLARHVHPG